MPGERGPWEALFWRREWMKPGSPDCLACALRLVKPGASRRRSAWEVQSMPVHALA